jgi:uncharacterized RDD family membrane protein YckC
MVIKSKANQINEYKWKRFLARNFDIYFESALISIFCYLFSIKFMINLIETQKSTVIGFIFLPLALILDAFVAHNCGNTLGKWLLGVNVTTSTSKKLSLKQYISRNFSFWRRGYAFGVVLIGLFLWVKQSRRIENGQQTTYDEDLKFKVSVVNTSILKTLSFSILFIGLITLSIYGLIDETSKTKFSENNSYPSKEYDAPANDEPEIPKESMIPTTPSSTE